MAEKKRQGQRGATPKPTCPKCGEYLKRLFIRTVQSDKTRKNERVGWMCPSSTCDYIVKDFVELEDETEPFEEIEND